MCSMPATPARNMVCKLSRLHEILDAGCAGGAQTSTLTCRVAWLSFSSALRDTFSMMANSTLKSAQSLAQAAASTGTAPVRKGVSTLVGNSVTTPYRH